jgi:uncharacterized damage-inducible protein DinB
MSKEAARIADQMDRAYHGDAWHGPSVKALLEDVFAEWAAGKPIVQAHCIWELVRHITCWKRVVLRRLNGDDYDPPDAENFPPLEAVDPEVWKADLAALDAAHEELLEAVRALPDRRLEEPVPGKNYNVYIMLHGAAQHDIYHAGQIALLKKAR